MSRFKHVRRTREEEELEPNLVPIMNMFLVLIPFLLMSASFYHVRIINTSVPVRSEQNSNDVMMDKKSDIKLTVILMIKDNSIQLSANSDEVTDKILSGFNKEIKKTSEADYPVEEIRTYLADLKKDYPKSDTLIMIPDETILYEIIIEMMDIARKIDENPLFPNVVLSGSLG